MAASVNMDYIKLVPTKREMTSDGEGNHEKVTFEIEDEEAEKQSTRLRSGKQLAKRALTKMKQNSGQFIEFLTLNWFKCLIILLLAVLFIVTMAKVHNIESTLKVQMSSLAAKCKSETGSLNIKIAFLEDTISNLTKELSNTQDNEISLIRRSIRELRERGNDMNKSVEEQHVSTRNSLKAMNHSFEEQILTLATVHKDSLKQEIKELQETSKAMNDTVTRNAEYALTVSKELATEVAQLEKHINSSTSALTSQLEAGNRDIASLNETFSIECRKISEKVSAVNTKMSSLKAVLMKTSEASTENFSEFSTQIEKIQAGINTVNHTVKLLSINLSKLRVEAQSNLSKTSFLLVHQLDERLTTNTSQLNEAIKRLETITSEADKNNEAKIDDLKANTDKAGQKIVEITEKVTRLEARLAKRIKDSKKSTEHELHLQKSSLSSRIDELKSSLQQMENLQKNRDKDQDRRVNGLQSRIIHLASSAYRFTACTLTTIVCFAVCLMCIML